MRMSEKVAAAKAVGRVVGVPVSWRSNNITDTRAQSKESEVLPVLD